MLVFVSDTHLDASRPQVAAAFFAFLAELSPRTTDALYLLGDVFELWVGDDDDDPFLLKVQAELKSLVDRGVPVYFMHGNRDFMINQGFAARSGVGLISDPTLIEVSGETVVLAHGDALCTRDQAYQAFRAESRGRRWYDTVMAKSLAERRLLGAQLRQQSKTMSSRKPEDIMDVSDEAVEKILHENHAVKLIHGHTHRPNRHQLSANRERIVLGDWDQQAWALYYDKGDWDLRSWSIPTE